jgi:hypothetical protein
MSQVFSGAVLLVGETGEGLPASFEMDERSIRLTSGDDELGTWDADSCDVTPAGKGAFSMALGGESLTFSPTSPSAFAEAMSIPLAPEPIADESSERPRFDYDAAIDEVIANVKPLRDANEEDDNLTKSEHVGIEGVSTAVKAGLLTGSMVI